MTAGTPEKAPLTGLSQSAPQSPSRLRRPIVVEGATIAALTCLVGVVHIVTKAPLYNPARSIDPWLYTALWTNLDLIYLAFAGTYYVARLPWIVPGFLLNELFAAPVASLILHSAFFLAGGLSFYFLCRRFLGPVAAALGYASLVGSEIYFTAHRWDYVDGAVLTYMTMSFAFGLPSTTRPVTRALSMIGSGFFALAAVTTRLVDIVYFVGLALLYFAVTRAKGWRARSRRFLVDLTAWIGGAAVLLIGGGIFSVRHGTEFLFFMPQVRAVADINATYEHPATSEWLPQTPYFWLPVFAVVLSVAALLSQETADIRARRFLTASVIWLALVFTGVAAYQFGGNGGIFAYSFSFASFLLPTCLCLAGSFAVLGGVRPLSAWSGLLIAGGGLAAVGPTAWVYWSDSVGRLAQGYTSWPYIVTFAMMAVALILVIASQSARFRGAAAVATLVALVASTHSVAASVPVWHWARSEPGGKDLYSAGQEVIEFLNSIGYGDELPHFWYDGRDSQIFGIQSLYLSGESYIGIWLPRIDTDFRWRMGYFRPPRLVLLCRTLRCNGAVEALHKAGYTGRLQRFKRIESGSVVLWALIYDFDAR
jgi:hypothetical protein